MASNRNATAPINRILRSSIVDGPGNRAAVFVQGCNFNCVYCHNPETIGREFSEMRIMTAAEVMADIEPSLAFIRGITVSGGECTLYPAFLCELSKLAHDKSLTLFLDSNGSYDFARDHSLVKSIDSVMLDIKADPDDPGAYTKVTGRAPVGDVYGGILERAEYLANAGKLWEVRTVISPGLFDAEVLIDKVCRRLQKINYRPFYKLIRYRPNGVRPMYSKTLTAPNNALMNRLAALCESYEIMAVVV
jgi:pyruvate formate lyase activating enzyme